MSENAIPDYEPPSYKTCDGVSERCPVELSLYGDYFNLGACIFFVVAHTLLLIAQSYLAWKSRAWSFAVYLGIGTIFEIMGYAARIALAKNPWIYDAFVIQLVMLILAPTLVAASISITFKHLVLWYGPEWSFLKPVLYPWVFVGTDFISIFIQAAGGAISAVATGGETDNKSLLDVGSGMLVAGVIFQLINMVFCGGLMLLYIWRRHRSLKAGPERIESSRGEAYEMTGHSSTPHDAEAARSKDKKTKIFIYAITVAYCAIIIRCIYRVPEMQMGWASDLMQNETTFLILDGTMILIAILTLTIFHPCHWFPFLSKNKSKKQDMVESQSDEIRENA